MKLGIVGLPNVGKSTLFNAITNAGAESAITPSAPSTPMWAWWLSPDHRLDKLSEMYHPKKTTPQSLSLWTSPVWSKGASKGEGLGNKFLSNIRMTDAIVHVVRCFDDENVIHVEGSTDPIRDMDTIDLELVMSDMEMVDRRIDKAQKAAKGTRSFSMRRRCSRACGSGSTRASLPGAICPRCRRMMPPSLPPASCSPSSR